MKPQKCPHAIALSSAAAFWSLGNLLKSRKVGKQKSRKAEKRKSIDSIKSKMQRQAFCECRNPQQHKQKQKGWKGDALLFFLSDWLTDGLSAYLTGWLIVRVSEWLWIKWGDIVIAYLQLLQCTHTQTYINTYIPTYILWHSSCVTASCYSPKGMLPHTYIRNCRWR